MKFRIFSIFAGIGQTIAMVALYYFIGFVLRFLIPEQLLSFETLGIGSILWLVACVVIGLAYPIHLWRQKQKLDAVVVVISTLVSFGIAPYVLYLMASQLAVID